MSPSKNNSFNASDLERYHAGKMSAAERHALEKAALDDPFLADALEGYTYTTTPAEDLSRLQQRLQQKLQSKKAIPLFLRYNNWMKAAAVFILIATLGWLAYRKFGPENQSIALSPQKQTEKKDSDSFFSPGMKDSTSALSNTIADQNKTEKTDSRTAARRIKKIPDEENRNKVASITVQTGPAGRASANRQADSVQIQTTMAEKNDQGVVLNANKGNSENDANAAKPSATVKNKIDAKELSQASPSANRAFKSNDTIHADVVLRPLSEPPAEEVVLQKSAQKKFSAPAPMQRVIIDTLEPAEGITQFDDYITSHLKTPEQTGEKPVSGEVQLTFEVNQNGEPMNITVVKSLCNKCDEEAVRLLKEGPKWKKKKNKKGKVTIRF